MLASPTPTQSEIFQRSRRFHAEIARKAATVPQPEIRTYFIPNTPYRVPKLRQPSKAPRNVEPDYWHHMWFHDLVFGRSSREKGQPLIEDIIRAVCTEFGVSKLDILSQRRTVEIVRPRQVAGYLAKKLTSRSLPEIGRRLGGRDHTTQIAAIRRIESIIAIDAEFAGRVAKLAASLGGRID